MKNNTFSEYIKPTLVLTIICFVVALILSQTYNATLPAIEKINKERADAARMEVLPTASEGFNQETPDDQLDGITEVYVAEGGCGAVFTVREKGFGGALTVMVGMDEQGCITGVKITEHSETPGLGTKAMKPDYLAQYIGAQTVSLEEAADAAKIDTVSGATISSKAVFRAVELATKQFETMGGVGVE